MFGSDYIKEDISELKKITLFTQGKVDKKINFKEEQFYILKNYPKTKKIITRYFNKFIKSVFSYNTTWKLTTSWAVKLNKGEQVHLHNHVNCMWSCVLYYGIYTDKSCPLKFKNPIREAFPFQIMEPTTNPMINDCAIKPETNKIIFFPSWLQHYSEINKEDARYSLACNFAPTGKFGYTDSTLYI